MHLQSLLPRIKGIFNNAAISETIPGKPAREKWIDAARGILILLVVIGHSGQTYSRFNYALYIYLFHMPAFFILSGYLYKHTNVGMKAYLARKARRLMIPYASYLLILTTFHILFERFVYKYDKAALLCEIGNNLFGGTHLRYSTSILWFLACLFIVEILWRVIDTAIKNVFLKGGIVVALYLLAHLVNVVFHSISLPLGLEYALLNLLYYYCGTLLRKFSPYILNRSFLCVSGLCALLILVLIRTNVLHYKLDICPHIYDNLFLDFFIPVELSFFFFSLCFTAAFLHTKFLTFLGINSLPIMALHLLPNAALSVITNNNPFLFVGVGLLFSLSCVFVIRQSSVLRMLFLGDKT